MIETVENKSNIENEMLNVKNFYVNFETYDGIVHALDDINFTLKNNEVLGILGESGSGKTTLATAIMGLLPENAGVKGSITLNGKTYLRENDFNSGKKLNRKQLKILDQNLRNIRWKDISIVFQGAMNSFNPVYTIGKQIREVYKLHTDLSDNEIEEKLLKTIRYAGLNKMVINAHPHELSGGMKQRAVIAMALALDPEIVIADEPTTGLDVITQAEIINQLKALKKQGKIKSMIIISHDIGVISQLADHIMVLYAGKIMEYGTSRDIYLNSQNPYTVELLKSYPSIKNAKKHVEGIPGTLPDPINIPEGCIFYERCIYHDAICKQKEPDITYINNEHYSRCYFASKLTEKERVNTDIDGEPIIGTEKKVETKDLVTYFDLKKSMAGSLFSNKERVVRAVDDINIEINRGEILGIVGESGSGKTTLARTIIGLIKPTAGEIIYNFENTNININKIKQRSKEYSVFRKNTQMIFQDPYDALNPKMTVYDIVAEPIIAHRSTNNPGEMLNMVKSTLKEVNLTPPENYLERFPHELSGGERQRVATARALVLNSELIVADEPTSMLDVSLRAGFMNLIKNLRNKNNLSILYISHDIASVYYLSDKIFVMYLGVGVEYGDSKDIVNNPLHPYTKALIKAVPSPTPDWNPGNIDIIGEIGNSINVPKGCRFYDRCIYKQGKCKNEKPPVQKTGTHWYLCHFTQDELDNIKQYMK